jgi:hypothetical protein
MSNKKFISVGTWLDSKRADLITHLEKEGIIENFVAGSYEVHNNFKFKIGIAVHNENGEEYIEYYPCTVLATHSNFAKLVNNRIGNDWKEYSKLNNCVITK